MDKKTNAPSLYEQIQASQDMLQKQWENSQKIQKEHRKLLISDLKKNMLLAILLVVFFGSLGLFYSTKKGALIMTGISLFIFAVFDPHKIPYINGVCLIWAVIAVKKHNDEADKKMID